MPIGKPGRLLTLALLALTGCAAPAGAPAPAPLQAPRFGLLDYPGGVPVFAGPDFPVANEAGFPQRQPSVAYNPKLNEYLVAFIDESQGNHFTVFAQRLSAAGAKLGGRIPIATADYNQTNPSVVYNPRRNEYLVVWDDEAEDGGGASQNDIYAQRVGGAGALLGGRVAISTAAAFQTSNAVAHNCDDDEYLIAWSDTRPGSESADVLGQRLSGAGALIGGEVELGTSPGRQAEPALAYSCVSHTFLASWTDDPGGDAPERIFARSASRAAVPLAPAFPVSTSANADGTSSVAFHLARNEFVIAWDTRTGVGFEGEIRAQRLSGVAALLGGNLTVSDPVGAFRALPAVVYNKNLDAYLVAWQDSLPGGIYAQSLSGAGALQGANFRVPTSDGQSIRPALAHNTADQHTLVLWQFDDGIDPSNVLGRLVR